MILATIIFKIILNEDKHIIGSPTNKHTLRIALNECQASVEKTKIVEEPGNFSVFKSSFHLFFQDNDGFQNNWLKDGLLKNVFL